MTINGKYTVHTDCKKGILEWRGGNKEVNIPKPGNNIKYLNF